MGKEGGGGNQKMGEDQRNDERKRKVYGMGKAEEGKVYEMGKEEKGKGGKYSSLRDGKEVVEEGELGKWDGTRG